MQSDMNIGHFLTTRSRVSPQQEMLYDIKAERRFSFREANHRANQLCHALSGMGLEPGDRVALLAYNGHQFIESFFGPAKAGLVIMPLNWRLTADELAFILKDGGAKALIFDTDFTHLAEDLRGRDVAGSDVEHWIAVGAEAPDFARHYERLLAQQPADEPEFLAGPEDNLFIMYTSGTTGLPKGVVHTHETVFWAIITMVNTGDIRGTDRYLLLLPLFHVGALAPMIGAVYRGNSLVILRDFDPLKVWQLFESERIDTSLAVPAMLNFMLQVPGYEQYDHSSVRNIICGAAPVPVATINAYIDLGIEIHQVYGLTESGGPGCLIVGEDSLTHVGSAGRAFFHTEAKIVDAHGETVPAGETGEILLRGRHMMKEYWNRPDATAETLQDGWLHTGDIATMDAEGFVTICDRKKDMIISGGENVYPAEIENVLMQHDGVADAAVIGLPSEKWGESPLAVIVAADEALTDRELMTFCQGKLARFKQPTAVRFVDSIPRNPSGKILKRLLRDQFLAETAE
ncbi:long-chain-fatty-acid--CoA ligase [Congregibacter litoralis]|uniref:Acyl-CoA synthetase (AMP-forming)/AMP-acid ligase II n=1 Tax=Congregibacter litoralis KT71 TaxID=314285 RepID=A4ABI0_9GAMM|nr:long-chain-fatty-acid--CoA ligase [Congregibacter litoralis]EAQ96734.2 Acyl-CoA synthetase (AMP-forming)/AMP-acid ligase II [Congregibacter litoralis KT71]